MTLFWLSIIASIVIAIIISRILLNGKISKYKPLKLDCNKCSLTTDANETFDSEKNNTISLNDDEINLVSKTKKTCLKLNTISSVRVIQNKKIKYHKDNLLELSGEGELLNGSTKCFLQFTSGYELHYWKKMIKSACFGTSKPFMLATNEKGNVLFSSFDLHFSQQLEKTLESQLFKEHISSRIQEMQNIPFVKSIKISEIHFRQSRPVLDGSLIQSSILAKEQTISAKYSVTMDDVLKFKAEVILDFLPLPAVLHINVDKVSGEVLVNCLPPLNFWITCKKLPEISYSVFMSLGFLKIPGIFIIPLITKNIMSEILSQIIVSPFGIQVDKIPLTNSLNEQEETEYSEDNQFDQEEEEGEDTSDSQKNTEVSTNVQQNVNSLHSINDIESFDKDGSQRGKSKKPSVPKKTKQEKIHDQVERQREKERDKILKKEMELEEKEKKKQEKQERKVQKGKDLRVKELEKSFERMEKLLKKDEEKKNKKAKDNSDDDNVVIRSVSVTPRPDLSPVPEGGDYSKKEKKKGHGKHHSRNGYDEENNKDNDTKQNKEKEKENTNEDLYRHHRHKSSHSSLKEHGNKGSQRKHTRHLSNRDESENSE